MPRSSVLSEVNIDVAEKSQPARVLDPDRPFRILVAGNFSGGAGRNRRPMEIDRDNFDQVMALVAPELRLQLAGGETAVSFKELEDFHPDQLFARIPALRNVEAPAQTRPAAAAPSANLSGADVLSMMMGEQPASARAPARNDWDQMIHDLVAPYAAPAPQAADPVVEATYETRMREILHAPAFQELEAAWRGLFFLVRRLDTGGDLKLYLLDLPQESLSQSAGLAELAQALDARDISVTAGLYYFGKSGEETLLRIAGLAKDAQVPFITGLAPEIAGLEEVFPSVRRAQCAPWLGLALPRFLLRLPYGKDTSSIESFAFEEMTTPPPHRCYLWGNPAIACAYLLGEAFSRYGWELRPGMVQDIDSLPAHTYRENGEAHLKPCAEVLLTEQAAEFLLDRGIMPLASIKDTDRVRLVRFQSVATPPAPLAGQWD